MREPHASHRCSDGKLVTGRSSKMIPINTTYQYDYLDNNGEYVVKNRTYTHDESDTIDVDLYETGLKNISEFFKVETVEELFKLCSKLKIEHSVKYSKYFIHFDFEETEGCDYYTGEPHIEGLLIRLYKVNKYGN